MSKDLKSPDQQPAEADRMRQTEEASRQYLDLQTGKICVDGYQELPNSDTQDPNVRVKSEKLANVSTKAPGVGQN